jgi:cyclophilin family peptidyl-prolyl cis-trans isomerase
VREARAAIVRTLTALGAAPAPREAAATLVPSGLTAEQLRRLQAPRARVQVRDLGSFEVALLTIEAPATVLKFAQLAESGYYDGSTFHRVVPNLAVHGGSPGAHDAVGHPESMRDEVGLWPHVRGTLGLATEGRDTGRARFFINLVDNPRFDHEYTVFGQVLNGIDVIDRILEGDVIERIEIIS